MLRTPAAEPLAPPAHRNFLLHVARDRVRDAAELKGFDVTDGLLDRRQRFAQRVASSGRRIWPGAASTPASLTSPSHYAALQAVFLCALAGVAALTRRRERDGSPAIPRGELPILALATFALADVITKEKISTWLREPFVQEGRDHKPIAAEGRGLRHAVGELLTCSRCIGAWSALSLVGLRTAAPAVGRSTATVLALAGANNVMQCGSRLLAERTNQEIKRTETTPGAP